MGRTERFSDACRYDTVLAWIGQLPEEVQSGHAGLLLVKAWLLSLSGKQEEAGQVIAAVERLGEPGGEARPAGFSSAEASLTMLRACCPWGDVGAQLQSGRRAVEVEGTGSPWRPLACWAVGMALYFRGELGEAGRWFAESAALAPCGRSPQADAGSGDEQLTGRERRVLQLLTSDLSERDIGQELYVSPNTVHSHVRSIYRKLGVSSRAHALQRTRELRLL